MKTKKNKKVFESNLSIGDGKIPSEALKKYFQFRNILKKAISSENVDTNNRDQVVQILSKVQSQGFGNDVEPEGDKVVVKANMDIVFWTNRKLQESPGIESSKVFDGLFENRPISVKRTPLEMSHAAVNEVAMLSKLMHHENVIRYLCKFEDPKHFYVVTDSYQLSLASFVRKAEFTERTKEILPKKVMLKQLCDAVEFLQRKRIVSMSLNPETVRVVSNHDAAVIKLTSFDFSVDLSKATKVNVGKGFRGAKGFVAPEIKKIRQANLTSDIYSLGCLCYFILTGGDLLCHASGLEPEKVWVAICLTKLQKFQERNKTCDGVLAALMIKRMLNFYSKKRPSIDTIKTHPYFWNTHEIFDLILEVARTSEDKELREQLKEKIELNKSHVIGDSWKKKIDQVVITEISKKRQYDEASIFHLVKAIRNQFAHGRCSPLLARFFGNTKEELKDYWLGKFPQLIPHLCRVMKLMTE